MWATSSSTPRPPFCFLFTRLRHSWPALSPSQPMLSGARRQLGAPGTAPSAELAVWWHARHISEGWPMFAGPRLIICWCGWRSSPWRGKSVTVWQFRQRGDCSTRATSPKACRDAAGSSAAQAAGSQTASAQHRTVEMFMSASLIPPGNRAGSAAALAAACRKPRGWRWPAPAPPPAPPARRCRRRLFAGDDGNVHLGRLEHPDDGVAVEILLLHLAVLEGDLAEQRRRQAEQDAASICAATWSG
ncbi:Uncharacterised protein [Chromobacterium violaceum]|uniref:Uncharacterized protein n=1 Tax=Chromobacterium violaceum TaxID=536 RepID=A0A3S5DLD8_CHRVL|nr:Uncharacterised protein [Chromobacterium violaceum]